MQRKLSHVKPSGEETNGAGENKPGSKKFNCGAKNIGQCSISRCYAIRNKMMHKCSITKDFKWLSKPKTSCVKPHSSPMPLLLFHSHLSAFINLGGKEEKRVKLQQQKMSTTDELNCKFYLLE